MLADSKRTESTFANFFIFSAIFWRLRFAYKEGEIAVKTYWCLIGVVEPDLPLQKPGLPHEALPEHIQVHDTTFCDFRQPANLLAQAFLFLSLLVFQFLEQMFFFLRPYFFCKIVNDHLKRPPFSSPRFLNEHHWFPKLTYFPFQCLDSVITLKNS